MLWKGKYSLVKALLSEASLDGKGTIFDERYPDRSVLFTTKMDNADAGDESSYFTLNSDQTTKIVIPKSAPGFNNTKLYDALVARDLGRYAAAFRKPHIQAHLVDSGEPELITGAGYLFKDKDFGRGGARSAQAIGTQYEEDAASYFKSILQKNLQAELQGGSAGASDIGSDNEYYIGTSRDDLAAGTNILKAEVKTSPGATYGQAQWRFKIDLKTFMPIEFKYQEGKKHFTKDKDGKPTTQLSPTGKLLDQLNDPIKTQLNSGIKKLQADMKAAAGSDKNWSINYKMAVQGEKGSVTNSKGETVVKPVWVSGFHGGEGGRNKVTQLVYNHIKAAFDAMSEKIKKDVGNAGYTYYQHKGDQFIIVGKGYGIYSLDQPETKELATALKIPSFKSAGETSVSLRTGGGRLINMPKVNFGKGEKEVKGAPFPGTIQDLAAAVESGGEVGRVAIGFALFIQGSLEGLNAAKINAKIDAAERILGASSTDAVDAIVADTVITKEDILGDPQLEGDEPGTQQNNSRQFDTSLSRLFEWAITGKRK